MERLHLAQLNARLRALGAVPQPDRSSSKAHIYHSPPTGRWIKIVRKGPQVVELTFHAQCPCAYS